MNIYDYIVNTKDSLLDEINIPDALIFTRLSYIHWEEVLSKLPITIHEFNNYLMDVHISKSDKKLVKLLCDSKRFKDIVIERCQHISDSEKTEEFTAITINLNNHDKFIAFRGTSKKVYDFKEDMNMSFEIVSSCFDAVDYVKKEKKYHKLYLGGHSKGGHLAMYAGSHVNFFIRNSITRIYNFDGPGFLEIDKSFNTIKNKIYNFFPESSIVGRIMTNPAPIVVIKTLKQGIEAHNLYNWIIINNDLVIGQFNANSNAFHGTCLEVLKIIPKEKRESVINYFFSLILKGEIKSIKEIDLEVIRKIINDMPHLLKEEKKVLMKFFKILIKCSIPNPINYRKKIHIRKIKN